MRKPLRFAISGAGPAGLAVGRMLAVRGHDVTVFERFEEPRPVGSGLMLQPTGLAVLAEMGLLDRILALGSPIDRLWGADSRTNRVVLDVRYAAGPGGRFGLGIHRAALFAVLFDAARESGVRFLPDNPVTGARQSADGIIPLIGEGEEAGRFDCLIDASGTASPLARSIGGSWPDPLPFGAFWATRPASLVRHDGAALEQRYRHAAIMAGILPVGRIEPGGDRQVAFFWSLPLADEAAIRARGIASFRDEVSGHWPDLGPLLETISGFDDLTVARYRHRTLPRPCSERLAVIGDAAHSTSPQLGQGANMALLDAAVLVAALGQEPDLGTALARYAALRRNHVRLFQALSLVFTPFYQSRSRLLPFLRDHFVASIARIPPVPHLLALIVSGMLLEPLVAAGLAEPDWEAERSRLG